MRLSKPNAELKETLKSEQLLLPSVRRHVLRKAQEPDDDRRLDVLHPSEMAKASWCPRHDFYRMTNPQGYPQAGHSARMESVYDYGHSVHRKWQRWLGEMGVLWGRWECRSCRANFFGLSPSHCEGVSCESTRFRYKEIAITGPHLAGHTDGLVMLGPDAPPRLIEIKTVGLGTLRFEHLALAMEMESKQLTLDEVWWRIKRPFPSHIRQGQLYLHYARTCLPFGESLDEIIFIYEWKPTQDAKEFVVKYNPSLIAKILEGVEDVTKALAVGQAPDRPSWAAVDHKTCTSCPVMSECYGRTTPPQDADPQPRIAVRKADPKRRRRALGA